MANPSDTNTTSITQQSSTSEIFNNDVSITKFDAFGRRIWDKEYHSKKALEKSEEDSVSALIGEKKEKIFPPVQERRPLQRRNNDINLESELGKTRIVTEQTPKMYQGGFWCSVCECLIKDSQAYMDHINGKKHNRLLGMSMKVEKVSTDSVREKLRHLHKKKLQKKESSKNFDYDEFFHMDLQNSRKRKNESLNTFLESGKDINYINLYNDNIDVSKDIDSEQKKKKKNKRKKKELEQEYKPVLSQEPNNKIQNSKNWIFDTSKETYYDHISSLIGNISSSKPILKNLKDQSLKTNNSFDKKNEWTTEDEQEKEQRILMGLPAGFSL